MCKSVLNEYPVMICNCFFEQEPSNLVFIPWLQCQYVFNYTETFFSLAFCYDIFFRDSILLQTIIQNIKKTPLIIQEEDCMSSDLYVDKESSRREE